MSETQDVATGNPPPAPELPPPEPSEAPAPEAKPAGHTPRRRAPRAGHASSGGSVLAVLALVASVVALAGGYLLWQQLQQTRAALAAAEAAAADRQDALRRELEAAIGRQGETLSASLAQATARTDTRVNENAQAVERLRQALGRDGNGWVAAEVQHLLRIANARLQLTHDVASAIAALETGDRRLAALADPAYTPVREAIARELRALRETGEADLTGIAVKLKSLADAVEQLPLASLYTANPAPQPAAPAPGTPREVSGWREFLAALWADIRGLVSIRHTGQESAPALLPPSEHFYLRENLRLKLQTARLALLNRQGAIYHAALSESVQWLRSYFAPEAPAVADALTTLETLARVPIQPELPDISGSLRALERVERRLQRDAGALPAERAP